MSLSEGLEEDEAMSRFNSLLGSSLAGCVNSSSQAVCARMARDAHSLLACLSSILMHGDDVLDVAVLQVPRVGLRPSDPAAQVPASRILRKAEVAQTQSIANVVVLLVGHSDGYPSATVET